MILLIGIVTLLIACVQCEPEDWPMLLLVGSVCGPAILLSVIGICTGKNFFEC